MGKDDVKYLSFECPHCGSIEPRTVRYANDPERHSEVVICAVCDEPSRVTIKWSPSIYVEPLILDENWTEIDEERQNVIGQNGNDGDHYE